MEQNLEDSLNLESAMGTMDFDHSAVVVSQADITLETSGQEEDIPMEFEQIEEQPIIMDTENEEIIEFMNDQYTLQEYSVEEDSTTDTSKAVEVNQLNVFTSEPESMIDFKNLKTFESEASISQETSAQPKYVALKEALNTTRLIKKSEPTVVTSMPRQVAIAPKPPMFVTSGTKTYGIAKQFSIAPKPVALVMNKGVHKMMTGTIQGSTKRKTLLAQTGKQFVMLPSGAQKIKLVSQNSGSVYVRTNSDQTQILTTKSSSGTNTQKPVIAKVLMQGPNADSNQPVVITKVLPSQPRYVMQQKTVPISIAGNKVLLSSSPTKSAMKIDKKQIISIKSPTSSILPTISQGSSTKKVVITTNPSQNVILKTTAPPKTAQVTKDGSVVVQGQQRSQLHQINVPGKGIQYIRLITSNSSSASQKDVSRAIAPQPAATSKNFVVTDNKGNLIQVTAEKMISGQAPPLVISGNISGSNKMSTKPQKLVRIAPATAKPVPPTTQQSSRSAQSLLTPLSTAELRLDEVPDKLHNRDVSETQEPAHDEPNSDGGEYLNKQVEINSKADLRALLEEAVMDDTNDGIHEVEVDFERSESAEGEEEEEEEEEEVSTDHHDTSNRSEDAPLIVIPNNYIKQETIRVTSENTRQLDDSSDYLKFETEIMPPYLSPRAHAISENDIAAGDLGLRPRKACNCTKSQCLKLYCDCFANGEFCNKCNCNNCHNNLENEELRQKAIRACLDRNPNAFRPKIGKTKSGGPEIIRRHNKGCNCKRSGCLKNYCECYEAKIACTVTCKCVGCRNVEDSLDRRRDAARRSDKLDDPLFRPPPITMQIRQPCSFMTSEVIEAVCQCLVAAAVESGEQADGADADATPPDPVRHVIDEFARCLQDIISASHHSSSLTLLDESQA